MPNNIVSPVMQYNIIGQVMQFYCNNICDIIAGYAIKYFVSLKLI